MIIVPASLKLNWQRECERWLTRQFLIQVVGSKDRILAVDKTLIIINYDILTKFPVLKEKEWDLLVVDECHKIKNPKSQRGAFIYGQYNKVTPEDSIPELKAKRKLFLTGTPIVNRPAELFPIIKYLDPERWGRKWGYFMSRYCNMNHTRWGTDVSGANVDRLPELQQILRQSIMVRRLKEDVLKELPPKTRQVIEMEPDSHTKQFILAELEAQAECDERYEELKAEVELAKATSETAYREAVKKLQAVHIADIGVMAKLRHDTAVAKIPYVVDYLQELLEEQDKVVVFCHHRDVIAALLKAFPDQSVKLQGGDSLEDRQAAIDDFQGKESVHLFLGSIQAAGVGITLTAASTVVFVELDWVPGNVSQAEDRLHRIGQKDAVNVIHLVLNGSVDSKLAKTIVEKQEIIEKALDGEIAQEPVAPVEGPATTTISIAKIEEQALEIRPEHIQAVHSAVRRLAAVCDGAGAKDGQGFNRIDARIGRSLAGLPTLTAKQCVLAKKILWKHKGQIPDYIEKIQATGKAA